VCKSDDCFQENSGAASYCTCFLFLLLLLFAVYDSLETDRGEMEGGRIDEKEEEKGEVDEEEEEEEEEKGEKAEDTGEK
jgi:hypothetical protein